MQDAVIVTLAVVAMVVTCEVDEAGLQAYQQLLCKIEKKTKIRMKFFFAKKWMLIFFPTEKKALRRLNKK